jgi:glucokinase
MPNSITIGIDIGGTRAKAALVAADGSLSHQFIEPSHISEPYPAVRDQLAHFIERLRSESSNTISSVGVGVAGLVDASRRTVLAAPNCPGVIGAPLIQDLEQLTGLHCLLDNDTNVMALGERSCGAARGCNHFIAVTLGTGVGGAVVIDGKLLRGFTGGGGEIGHVCIERSGPKCGCGSNGCLEAFIGLKGILRWSGKRYPTLKGIGIAKLSEMAANGDLEAISVFEYVGKMLGVGLAGMVNVFNPQMVVVGGGVAAAGELLFEPLERELQRRAFGAYLEGLQIRPARLGNWAGVVGAGMLKEES